MATVTISLPDQIARKLDYESQRHGFSTRSEFIRSLLRKYFIEEELKLEEFEPIPLEQLRAELAQTGKYSEEFINSVINGFEQSPIYEK